MKGKAKNGEKKVARRDGGWGWKGIYAESVEEIR